MRVVKNGDVHVSAPIGMPRAEVVRFVREHRDWIAKARKKTDEQQKRRAAFYDQLPLETKAQADEALERLKTMVEPMVESHAEEMGVRPAAIRYKPMISRWGVCNVKDRSICCCCQNGVLSTSWFMNCVICWSLTTAAGFMS